MKPIEKRSRRGNPFPGKPFFFVPIALYEKGTARLLRPAQFIRYVTLLRLLNYNYNKPFSVSLSKLEELDGISTRAARDALTKLQEFGLVRVERTNPFTYRLVHPQEWEDIGPIRPTIKRSRSLEVSREYQST